jgi:hypothetical protein
MAKDQRTYRSWRSMIARCTEPTNNRWRHYGGRGIAVCDRWMGAAGYESFVADMGIRPPGKSIDRIETNGPYEQSNCRWATGVEQNSNRSITHWVTFGGETKTLAEWARLRGLSAPGLRYRIRRWGVEAALSTAENAKHPGVSKVRQRKLTADDVIEIRRRRAAGAQVATLAEEFGISGALVSQIALRRAWAHVADTEGAAP